MVKRVVKQRVIEGLTTSEFRKALLEVIGDAPAKIWVVRSIHGRLETVFAVGAAQAEPIKMFDHIGGLYLLGEGVTPEMLPKLHNLFERYCHSHPVPTRVVIQSGLSINYRSYTYPGPKQKNKIIMHVPFVPNPRD